MLVLGIDPGSRVTGYGLVEKQPHRLHYIDAGIISAPDPVPLYRRIHRIFQGIVEIMMQHRPQELSIEDVFVAKNVRSSLRMGHARGAIMIAAVQCNIRIFEYTPLEIKKSVVGYGRASKEQVRSMVQVILKLKTPPVTDAADALAAAICHLNWTRYELVQE
jgi:crossover junction endodeoxyribonuclease RuvC